jgi:uncharacterized surface anchored protein
VFNERQKARVSLEKAMELPEGLPESANPYGDVRFALFAKEDITCADGKTAIPAGALVEVFGVGKDGRGTVQADLPFGRHAVREIATAAGYALDEREYPISFEPGAKKGEVAEIAINGGAPIANKLARGSLRIVKTFEGKDKPIAGVEFEIAGRTDAGTSVNIKAKTDEKGEIALENLLVGKYEVKELASSLTEGYVLSPAESVAVAAGKLAEMAIENKLARGNVEVLKVDADTGLPLEGAKFGIYKDGKLLAEATSGKDGIALFEGMPCGEYEIMELAAPKGSIRTTEKFRANVKENAKTVSVSLKNKRAKPARAPETPATGDPADILPWAALLAAAASGTLLVGRKARR